LILFLIKAEKKSRTYYYEQLKRFVGLTFRYYGCGFQPRTTDRYDVHRDTVGVLDRVHLRVGFAIQKWNGRGVRDQRERRFRKEQPFRDYRENGREILQFVQHKIRQRRDRMRFDNYYDVVQYVLNAVDLNPIILTRSSFSIFVYSYYVNVILFQCRPNRELRTQW